MGVWGHSARVNILVEFFNFQIEADGLIDIEPISKGPTWRNNRASARGISKRIDIFLVSDSVYKVWIDIVLEYWLLSLMSTLVMGFGPQD
jgi:hypothetical protein